MAGTRMSGGWLGWVLHSVTMAYEGSRISRYDTYCFWRVVLQSWRANLPSTYHIRHLRRSPVIPSIKKRPVAFTISCKYFGVLDTFLSRSLSFYH